MSQPGPVAAGSLQSRPGVGPDRVDAGADFLARAAAADQSGINILLALAGVLTLATGDVIDGVIILVLIAINVGPRAG